MRVLLSFAFIVSFVIAFGCGSILLAKEGGGGIAMEAALGMPFAQINNPDGTKAYYSGLSLLGRLHVPLYENPNFSFDLMGSLKYLDYKNTANNGTLQEYAQHIGGGPGLEIRILKFIAGFESHYMVARQNTVGTFSHSFDYTFPTTTYYYGVTIPRGFLALSFTYSATTGSVPQDKTNLSSDSPYADHAYWFHIKYATGYDLSDFWRSLVGK
jgi:hypothetical protein